MFVMGLDLMRAARWFVRPFGYLAFVLALASLSAAAKLLGDEDELGFFSERLARHALALPRGHSEGRADRRGSSGRSRS